MNEERDKETPIGMTTLSECMEIAISRGFTVQFMMLGHGLGAAGSEKTYIPGDLLVENFYRFEGVSDPDDASIMYLLVAADGIKGTLVDAYGVYADSRITEFMRAVQGIHKSEAE